MRVKITKKQKIVAGMIAFVAVIGGVGIWANSISTTQNGHSSSTHHHTHVTRQICMEPKYIDHVGKLDRHDTQPSNFNPGKLHAKEVLVMDASNGNVLYNKGGHKLCKVASLAKLMTLYLVQRKARRINGWNDVVNIPNNLRKMSYDTKNGLGGFKFQKGHNYTVRGLYEAAMIRSSNNAAIALGEWMTNGSNPKFVKMMNEQAKAWHLKAHFISSSGLENDDLKPYNLKITNGKKSGNEVSAIDIAIVAQHLLREYPQITNLSKRSSATVDGQKMYNVASAILPGGPDYSSDLRIDGLKSGYTKQAGGCYLGTCKPAGKHRIITVVLKDSQELQDTKKLMYQIYRQLGDNA